MYLGLDVGDARTGIALAQEGVGVATPHSTVETSKLDETISQLISQYDIQKIIVGLPLSLSGQDTQQTTQVRQMAEKMQSDHKIPVELVDERLTSRAAIHHGQDLGIPEKEMKNHKDEMAAQMILQSFLDTQQ